GGAWTSATSRKVPSQASWPAGSCRITRRPEASSSSWFSISPVAAQAEGAIREGAGISRHVKSGRSAARDMASIATRKVSSPVRKRWTDTRGAYRRGPCPPGRRAGAAHLDATHSQRGSPEQLDRLGGRRRPEGGPSAVRVELGGGGEQLRTAGAAGIGAGRPHLLVLPGAGALGASLAQHLVLGGG